MRIATWNINSLRLRMPTLRNVVAALKPDVVCLQETKVPDELFPLDDVRALGFEHILFAGMKGYNGVAILSKAPLTPLDPHDWCEKGDCRHISAILPSGAELHNFYIPAGGDIPDPALNDKFAHKLRFVDELADWFRDKEQAERILVGDLNIAPLEEDVWSHKQLLKVVSHTPVETEAMARLMEAGAWADVARADVRPPARLFSWWSYRAADWAAVDKGRRLDHIWTRGGVAHVAGSSRTLKHYRGAASPSDHVPVLATFPI